MPFHPPASGWQRKNRGLIGGDLLSPLLGIAFILLLLVCSSISLVYFRQYSRFIVGLELFLLVPAGFLFYLTRIRIKRNLMEPLSHLRNWALRMRNGNLSAQIPVPHHGEFAVLAKDINELGESLRSLSREMDDAVEKQTERLEKKTQDLEILYEVAANSNNTTDLTDLLIRYLGTIQNILGAEMATVRLLNNDDLLVLLGSIGFRWPIHDEEQVVPIERCLCAQNYSDSILYCHTPAQNCHNLLPQTLADLQHYSCIAIPLQYQKRNLGIYHCFIPKANFQQDAERDNLLTNIAQHLSLAIEKERLDDESRLLSIMQERTLLAHELHDSLAQTLASLRFRVSTLIKMNASADKPALEEEMTQIKNGLDEANNELRELLAHFRIPMDERGLVPATKSFIEKFQQYTGISVFFQNECQNLKLPSVIAVQILHIIQESLTNIRKHSQAENVRVLLRNLGQDQYHLLIEDDGIGMAPDIATAKPGEHVGLSIMQERARRIEADLTIESEPGEGTRVELRFFYTRNFRDESTAHR